MLDKEELIVPIGRSNIVCCSDGISAGISSFHPVEVWRLRRRITLNGDEHQKEDMQALLLLLCSQWLRKHQFCFF
jgi:hypothetical protein